MERPPDAARPSQEPARPAPQDAASSTGRSGGEPARLVDYGTSPLHTPRIERVHKSAARKVSFQGAEPMHVERDKPAVTQPTALTAGEKFTTSILAPIIVPSGTTRVELGAVSTYDAQRPEQYFSGGNSSGAGQEDVSGSTAAEKPERAFGSPAYAAPRAVAQPLAPTAADVADSSCNRHGDEVKNSAEHGSSSFEFLRSAGCSVRHVADAATSVSRSTAHEYCLLCGGIRSC